MPGDSKVGAPFSQILDSAGFLGTLATALSATMESNIRACTVRIANAMRRWDDHHGYSERGGGSDSQPQPQSDDLPAGPLRLIKRSENSPDDRETAASIVR